jgi:hypothetical protein
MLNKTQNVTIKRSLNVLVVLCAAVFLGAVGLRYNIIKLPGANYDMSFVDIADFSVDEELVGASHNVFVAKVIKKTGNKIEHEMPFTQYEVEVQKNIKGDLDGRVTVLHQGGYEYGMLDLVSGAREHPQKMGFLEEGKTYLLTSRYRVENDTHYLILHPNSRMLVSSDLEFRYREDEVPEKVKKRVKELKEAYKHEVIPKGDAMNNTAYNNYKETVAK